MDVSVLLEPTIDLERLAEVLDGLGHEGRVHATRTWDKKRQAALWEAAKPGNLDLDFLVPSSVGELVEVIHQGKNTLPAFSHFQKRFTRLPEGDVEKIAGYNHQTLAPFSGPGYFVCRMGTGEHEGEIEIDYTKVPKNKPASWPDIKTNDGLNGLVYGGMVDYLRRLSTHVTIGRAWRGGKVSDNWFALVRKDLS